MHWSQAEAEFKGSVHKIESQISNRKSVSNNLLVNITMIIFNIHTSLEPRLAPWMVDDNLLWGYWTLIKTFIQGGAKLNIKWVSYLPTLSLMVNYGENLSWGYLTWAQSFFNIGFIIVDHLFTSLLGLAWTRSQNPTILVPKNGVKRNFWLLGEFHNPRPSAHLHS